MTDTRAHSLVARAPPARARPHDASRARPRPSRDAPNDGSRDLCPRPSRLARRVVASRARGGRARRLGFKPASSSSSSKRRDATRRRRARARRERIHAQSRSLPVMSTVIETTPRGDVEVETEASRARDARRDAETRARRDCEAARRRETRETCERLVTFLRVVATERGRGMETEVFGGNEGLKHRGRLLKLRVRVARVRMQPKRARRPANRVRESGDESVGGGG